MFSLFGSGQNQGNGQWSDGVSLPKAQSIGAPSVIQSSIGFFQRLFDVAARDEHARRKCLQRFQNYSSIAEYELERSTPKLEAIDRTLQNAVAEYRAASHSQRERLHLRLGMYQQQYESIKQRCDRLEKVFVLNTLIADKLANVAPIVIGAVGEGRKAASLLERVAERFLGRADEVDDLLDTVAEVGVDPAKIGVAGMDAAVARALRDFGPIGENVSQRNPSLTRERIQKVSL